MRLVPLWDRVAIRRMETVAGLVIPASVNSQESLGRGIVHAIGEGVRKIKVDDEVFFTHPRNGPMDLIHLDGKDYILVEECLVVAKVTE
jgi:co-chaperonin GroES (HSP10)